MSLSYLWAMTLGQWEDESAAVVDFQGMIDYAKSK
jgi:hypothetical protein